MESSCQGPESPGVLRQDRLELALSGSWGGGWPGRAMSQASGRKMVVASVLLVTQKKLLNR